MEDVQYCARKLERCTRDLESCGGFGDMDQDSALARVVVGHRKIVFGYLEELKIMVGIEEAVVRKERGSVRAKLHGILQSEKQEPSGAEQARQPVWKSSRKE